MWRFCPAHRSCDIVRVCVFKQGGGDALHLESVQAYAQTAAPRRATIGTLEGRKQRKCTEEEKGEVLSVIWTLL